MSRRRQFLQDADYGESLEEFVKKTQQRGPNSIVAEYNALQALDKDPTTPAFDKNTELNRFRDIRCFEHTRVQLSPPNDYVHANFVDGFQHPKKFICTQGPMRKTIDHFWRMVWQEKSVVIVALTRVAGTRCELYFPDEAKCAILAGHIKIQTIFITHVRKTFEKCYLQISKGQQKRRIILLLYHAWPDHATPDSSTEFLNFMEEYTRLQHQYTDKLRAENQWTDKKFGPPIVVHCSAGVGRTGTLCALDIITEGLRKTKEMGGVGLINIPKTVAILRTQRHKAVQRPEQYLFLYLVTIEYALRNDLIPPEQIDLSAFVRRQK